jgi:hypothetical protein
VVDGYNHDPRELVDIPEVRHFLKRLAIMYAAFQKVDPSADLGADFSGEYAVALKAYKGS